MIDRKGWTTRIEHAWKEAPVVWLTGVRRVGKTTLTKSFGEENILYVNGDLPSSNAWCANPELFYRDCRKPIVVFDEIHQLSDPSRLLKIGADEFPHLKILATGSSTLAATKKFKDTLTGRKRTVLLLPVLWDELSTFENTSLSKRLYHGGLPSTLLNEQKMPSFYREWMDSFYARDIQKLFSVRDVNKFNLFFEYLLRESGGQLEISSASQNLGISRPALTNYLSALELTHAIHVIRPYFKNGKSELTKMPKVYGFDTGFVSWARGWDPLRNDDFGVLWEHMALDFLLATFPDLPLRYWRTKQGHEIDFVLSRRRDEVDIIECKWDPEKFDPTAFEHFRSLYPQGQNIILCAHQPQPQTRKFASLSVLICDPSGLPL